MKFPESGYEVLKVRAAPLEDAQEMDRRVRVVVPDILRQLVNPAKNDVDTIVVEQMYAHNYCMCHAAVNVHA